MNIVNNAKNVIFCQKCSNYKPINTFLKNAKILKHCLDCRKKARLYTKNHLCEHECRPSRCVRCFPKYFCIHKKRRDLCIPCEGSLICKHSRQRHTCKVCNDNDPLDITIKQMVYSSRQKDRLNNRYDAEKFVDYCFLKGLIEDCDNRCHYCDVELQYKNFVSNLGTIDRIDNNIGHNKNNVVISCRSCNYSRVNEKMN